MRSRIAKSSNEAGNTVVLNIEIEVIVKKTTPGLSRREIQNGRCEEGHALTRRKGIFVCVPCEKSGRIVPATSNTPGYMHEAPARRPRTVPSRYDAATILTASYYRMQRMQFGSRR